MSCARPNMKQSCPMLITGDVKHCNLCIWNAPPIPRNKQSYVEDIPKEKWEEKIS